MKTRVTLVVSHMMYLIHAQKIFTIAINYEDKCTCCVLTLLKLTVIHCSFHCMIRNYKCHVLLHALHVGILF